MAPFLREAVDSEDHLAGSPKRHVGAVASSSEVVICRNLFQLCTPEYKLWQTSRRRCLVAVPRPHFCPNTSADRLRDLGANQISQIDRS